MSTPDSASFWDNMYLNNQAGWDMRSATPVFENLLDSGKFTHPGRILIAGCGKGYDAVLAAKKGYDVYAMDISGEAIRSAIELAEKENVRINFIHEDIFKLDSLYKNYFDYVYDYVTYCAIIPGRRAEYAEKISGFLKPGGKLIALLFPVERREGGPPFAVDVQEFYRLFSRYLFLKFSSKKINSIKPRKQREILQIYLKKEVRNTDADQS
jgi:methyl halide transferase